MAKKSASPKLVEAARLAYQGLVLVQNHSRAQRKILAALPRHKIVRYEKISTSLTVKLYNAQNKWDRAIDKLSPRQVDELFLELVV